MATMKEVLFRPETDRESIHRDFQPAVRPQQAIIAEPAFVQMIRLERRRAERSGHFFILALVSGHGLLQEDRNLVMGDVAAAIASTARETDMLGWYEDPAILGILMTEITKVDTSTIDLIKSKLSAALRQTLNYETYLRLNIVLRVFPNEVDAPTDAQEMLLLYPDLQDPHDPKRQHRKLKRTIDIAGSVFGFLLFLPAFAVIAILIKLTSVGPILFCQRRVGQYGKEFTFYKFRTMYADNDPQIHREYVTRLIAGGAAIPHSTKVFKLTNDPRITPLGKILRKTSLDELPQFANVLMNQMSLVGPRPPVPYEYERYQRWHKRRILELKPGLTGLWQLKGRSRTTFDQMVRMDLKYSREESLWMDLKIILQTPAAMIFGRGAC
jgi:lipopolysaccharide/colanic/teichoic acid biosynthesis glycosyltransferase